MEPAYKALLLAWRALAEAGLDSARVGDALVRSAAELFGAPCAVVHRARSGTTRELMHPPDAAPAHAGTTAPLTARGEALGALTVFADAAKVDAALLAELANAAALGLRSALDHEALERRAFWDHRFLESCPSIIFLKNLEGRYEMVNEFYVKTTDHPRAFIIGNTDDKLYSQQLADFFRGIDRQVAEGGVEIVTEDKFFIGGKWHVMLAVKFPVRDHDGKLLGVGGVATEMTDQEHSKESLRRSEEQLHFITDALPELMSYVDLEQRFHFVNTAHEKWFGQERAEIVGKTIRDLVGGWAHAELAPYIDRVARGERCTFDVRIPHSDGRARDSRVTFAPQFTFTGDVEGFVALIADVSAEKLAEDRIRFLAESSSLLGSSLDYQATFKAVAALAVPRLADWCAIDTVGADGARARLAEVHADPDRAPPEKFPIDVDEVIRTGAAALCEEAPPGEPVRSAMVVPITTRRGMFGAITLVITDSRRRFDPSDLAHVEEVSRRAALAVENSQLYAEAQRAIHLRDEFLAIAGHELRTPLTSLLLQLDVMRDQTEDARVQERLRRARNHVKQLERLIRDLLDVSRIQAGRLELRLEPVDLGRLVREVAERFSEQATRSRCALTVKIPDEPIVGKWDAARLDQVTTNLISNAIKYGGGKPVEVELSRHDGHAALSVKDHGIGISPTDQERIFERFERAVSERHYGGLGLGLWISRQAVGAMGGRIRVESTPRVETSFIVEIPMGTA